MNASIRNRITSGARARPRPVLGALVLAALAALIPLACVDSPDPVDVSGSEALWLKQEPAIYAYVVRPQCFCIMTPVHVVATRDSVLIARDSSRATGLFADAEHKQRYSMDSIFAEVQARLNLKHDSHRISFDKTYGFLESAYIDFDKQAVDEEYGLAITDFRPLNAIPPKDSLP